MNFKKYLVGKKKLPALENCISFKLRNEETELLLGGFKEYKPPIYDLEKKRGEKFQQVELFHDISQIDKNV